MTVIEYVLTRLREIGVTDIFGVPGDFSFPINDAICHSTQVRWIGCCNELNAAYAADGYARVRGVGAVCTTYGVGELSALNGIAGSYAERLPVFHLVGMPNSAAQESRLVMHHTLGNGEYDFFYRMTEPVVCARAILTPQNVVLETERIIAEALYRRRPAYFAFPADLAEQPVLSAPRPAFPMPSSNPESLAAAVEAIVAALGAAGTACVLPGVLLARTHLAGLMREVIEKAGLPFATMFWDKSVIDEQHPQHMGMYEGALLNEHVRGFVESCDRVLMVGTIMSDFNSGAFTAHLDPEKMIRISLHRVHVGKKLYANIEMHDILASLLERLPKRDWKRVAAQGPDPVIGSGSDPITAASLYPRWERFLRPNDILMAETGTASMGMGFTRMPSGATFYNQTLWGSIGWATPAAFGAGIAAPQQRVVLITGEGAHQFTVQEISQFARYGLKPVVFVLNNNGYLIERLLCKEPEIEYNDIAPWRYADLPRAFGCDGWFTARATTCGELDAALEAAGASPTGAYVEVVTDPYAASPLALKLHDSFRRLYKA
jgi:indolepyruvate decarboxylase